MKATRLLVSCWPAAGRPRGLMAQRRGVGFRANEAAPDDQNAGPDQAGENAAIIAAPSRKGMRRKLCSAFRALPSMSVSAARRRVNYHSVQRLTFRWRGSLLPAVATWNALWIGSARIR